MRRPRRRAQRNRRHGRRPQRRPRRRSRRRSRRRTLRMRRPRRRSRRRSRRRVAVPVAAVAGVAVADVLVAVARRAARNEVPRIITNEALVRDAIGLAELAVLAVLVLRAAHARAGRAFGRPRRRSGRGLRLRRGPRRRSRLRARRRRGRGLRLRRRPRRRRRRRRRVVRTVAVVAAGGLVAFAGVRTRGEARLPDARAGLALRQAVLTAAPVRVAVTELVIFSVCFCCRCRPPPAGGSPTLRCRAGGASWGSPGARYHSVCCRGRC